MSPPDVIAVLTADAAYFIRQGIMDEDALPEYRQWAAQWLATRGSFAAGPRRLSPSEEPAGS
jgi:hypothetical protein